MTPPDCTCTKCVSNCRHKPGWFAPGQVEKVAEYLEIPLQELFETKLMVDYWASTENPTFVLSPSIMDAAPGTEFPMVPIGACVFLTDNNKCAIHPVKPLECKESHHDRPRSEMDPIREQIVADWLPNRQQIVDLLGREPEMPFPTLEDVFGILKSAISQEGLTGAEKMLAGIRKLRESQEGRQPEP